MGNYEQESPEEEGFRDLDVEKHACGRGSGEGEGESKERLGTAANQKETKAVVELKRGELTGNY